MFIRLCIYSHTARDKSEVVGAAFDKTMGKMSDNVRNLWGWSDDGTEADVSFIYIHVITAHCYLLCYFNYRIILKAVSNELMSRFEFLSLVDSD